MAANPEQKDGESAENNPATTPDRKDGESAENSPATIKITMNITPREQNNAEYIKRLTNARTKADAVSTALSLTRFVIEKLASGDTELLIRNKSDRSLEKILMPELENLYSDDARSNSG